MTYGCGCIMNLYKETVIVTFKKHHVFTTKEMLLGYYKKNGRSDYKQFMNCSTLCMAAFYKPKLTGCRACVHEAVHFPQVLWLEGLHEDQMCMLYNEWANKPK